MMKSKKKKLRTFLKCAKNEFTVNHIFHVSYILSVWIWFVILVEIGSKHLSEIQCVHNYILKIMHGLGYYLKPQALL